VPILPEGGGYRLKKRLLGPPLHSEALEHERLGIPTAVAVFSSDCISSSAYATEEILRILIPAVGVFAFSLVVPITVAMIVVLFFLIMSYRETIKEYPTAGGAYMVTRDNFGLLPAQVAGVSLLTDYILTVAVSTAAGTDALTSVFTFLTPYHVLIALGFVGLIAFVNLRGVKESGKVFMVPTYLFIGAMFTLIGVGISKIVTGVPIHHVPIQQGAITTLTQLTGGGMHGVMTGIFYGAGLWVVLQAFASGGSAVTGVEAISNGVTAFHKPEWKNARKALVIMGATLAICFFGLSFFATKVHPVPYTSGTPTVISQVGKNLFGHTAVGGFMYLFLQASTMMILVLAANTSFADFPRLANFHAGDAFMPKQLTKRGHRLVFSNGVIALAGSAAVLLLATGASVSALIPLYAVGVFTSFTMSQSGMAKHHLTKKEKGWKVGFFINGTGAVLSGIVDAIILGTKFMHGAWVIVIFVPVMVYFLTRLNKQYSSEAAELEEEAPAAATAPILRRHVVLVMVDQLNRATARAIQYGRTLTPDEIRAVHFAIDEQHAEKLMGEWGRLGLARVPLQIIECPDRRVARCALEVSAEAALDGSTEVTVLLPRLEYRRPWHRLLHDRTAGHIASALGDLPHVNVTFVPYHLDAGRKASDLTPADVLAEAARHHTRTLATVGGDTWGPGASDVAPDDAAVLTDPSVATPSSPAADSTGPAAPAAPTTGIGAARFRDRTALTGRIKDVQVQPWGNTPSLQVTLVDDTGQIAVIFLGRRAISGIRVGARLQVTGVVGQHKGRLALLNPQYRLLG